ncbi:MAG: ABC transporter permease [Planctomycetota bacterium]
MLALAIRIIMHQPLRYLVALMGISFAAGLAFIQLSLYIGFKENASIIADHTDGDVWVCARFHENFDFPKQLNPGVLELVRATRGVKSAAPLLLVFSQWRLEGGAEKTVQIVGYDVAGGVGRPWQLLTGFSDELDDPGAVTIDTTAQRKLDHADVGSTTEIGNIRAQVVGITDGIRSFQGNPMIFTDLNNARSFGHLNSDAVHYIVVKLEPTADRNVVLSSLRNIEYCEAYSSAEFSKKAQDYWLNSTGAGPALAMAALMGLIVGVVVAGQVLYTSTLENIKEYGTLKAIGASNLRVSSVIVAQAVAWALPAHLIAGGLLMIAKRFIGGKGVHLSLDFHTYCILGVFTVGVCVVSSMLSVIRAMHVEPVEVFKG